MINKNYLMFFFLIFLGFNVSAQQVPARLKIVGNVKESRHRNARRKRFCPGN